MRVEIFPWNGELVAVLEWIELTIVFERLEGDESPAIQNDRPCAGD